MSPTLVVITLISYLLLLFLASYLSGNRADNDGFFIGNRRTTWYMATLAMIGAAMSGVTYISVPGSVADDSFSYMQMVVGFTIGQFIVAFVLVPLFYRLRVVSLYEYLDQRFGVRSHRVGAWCFLVAKIIGAALKLYVVCAVMQILLFNQLGVSLWVNVLITMTLVWLYTLKGGVRSLIITDSIQSICLVGSVVVCVWCLCRALGIESVGALADSISSSPYSQIWFFDNPASGRYFWKMVAGGALCLVAMTGLDQDMMQRNMSCRTVRDSQINIVLTAICQIFVILLLLVLGVLLYQFIEAAGLPTPVRGDDAFPIVAMQGGLPQVVGIVFILGLISSTYSAAGSALTSLTTSFTIDIMGAAHRSEADLTRTRKRVHTAMAIVVALCIMVFNWLGQGSVINLVFRLAGYTYGPILGMFVYGIVSRRRVRERYVPIVAIVAPVLSFALQYGAAEWFAYEIGFELLGYNALITIIGLMLISSDKIADDRVK
ncbi:MAG: sodium:solute symporter [Alistipes sp.]|nr:sodium:solute symporter [Alistipes sp.]